MNTTLQPSRLSALLADARRQLVDTGMRNRLMHVNRAAKRANALNIVNERSEDIYRLLRTESKRMRFWALGEEELDEEVETDGLFLAVPNADDSDREARYQDLFLETRLGQEALQRRLLRLFTDARTAEEEQGVNILYLAMGFLRWFESDSSEIVRESPLILLPVQLVRNDGGSRFYLEARDTEIITNLPLQKRLREDFSVKLPEISEDEGFAPEDYFDDLAERIENHTRWDIDRDGMQLGFFSFSKLLMWRDLDPEQWPEGAFEEHPVLDGLLGDGFEEADPLFGPNDPLDPRLAPADLIHVVQADASQTRVIEEVRAGRDLVVQGPPGTGKSQTIANIIAGAVHDGKTVLFVAEKMAALSVVHDRLKKVGLSNICLEIHSRAANKKALLAELGRTLDAGRVLHEMPGPPDALRDARDELNRVSAVLHDPVPKHAFTPFRALAEMARFIGKELPPPSLAHDGLAEIDEATRQRWSETIGAYAGLLAEAGLPSAHPFAGVGTTNLQPTDLQRLDSDLLDVLKAMTELQTVAAQLAEAAGRPRPLSLPECVKLHDLLHAASGQPMDARDTTDGLLAHADNPRLQEALAAGRAWAEAHEAASSKFADIAFGMPADALHMRIAPGARSFWPRLFGNYRSASKELATLLSGSLPKTPSERLSLVEMLADVQRRRRILADEEEWLKAVLGPEIWRGESTPFAAILSQAEWLGRITSIAQITDVDSLERLCAGVEHEAKLREAIDAVNEVLTPLLDRLSIQWTEGEDIALDALAQRIEAMHTGLDRFSEWAHLSRLAEQLKGNGLGGLVERLNAGDLAPEKVVDEFLYATAEARWDVAIKALPSLNDLAALDRHALVNAFRTLEQNRLEQTQQLVRTKHLKQLPTGAAGQMAFLRGEMAKKRAHKPIRQIMKTAGQMVQRIKPVLLMSPISIAQYLPPGAAQFDLLVIDEASQVRPEDALGAIMRCGRIAVVGDQKQLPPTSFFDRISGSDDVDFDEDAEEEMNSARATEMESVLTLCEARGLNSAMLEWHYRSRDPSLIRVNNAEFYGDKLKLPPSPLQNDPEYGLAFRRVPGVYTSKSRGTGRPGTNRIEAEEVAKAVAEHARTHPKLSLGVVAFSKAQSDMLTEVLEIARRNDKILDAFLREGKAENVFVKSIENVQGDERDVILISVGYGPAEPNGRLVSMSFGPVNGEGGERRLNVLFSRARTRCVVFCSFDPNNIDTSRTRNDGPRVFKRFLEFARSRQMDEPGPTGGEADSPLESDVADEITRLGYRCDHQVGSAGFLIDLGVRHPEQPGRYILAVECDGATYHSALWARERDRLRQDVLEGLGWRFHRIWSTDWFYRRNQEIDRLKAALEEAAIADGPEFSGANTDRANTPVGEGAAEASAESAESVTLPPPPEHSAPAYVVSNFTDVVSNFTEDMDVEPHDAPIEELADLVVRIVEAEGPIHRDLIARRVSAAFGKLRAGGRIQEASNKALRHAVRSNGIAMDGHFAMTAAQRDDCPVRDRSGKGAPTKADLLPPLEIRTAAGRVIEENGEMPRQDLIAATARILGFARIGKDLRDRIARSLK